MATNTEEKAIAKKPSSNVQVYGEYEFEEYGDDVAGEELDELESDVGQSEHDKLKVGRNVRRILPPPKGTAWGPKGRPSPFCTSFEHFFKVPGAKRPITFGCPRRMAGKTCIVCNEAKKLKANKSPVDNDMAYELFPNRQVRVNWINRSAEDRGVLVGRFGKRIHEDILELKEEVGDFSHPLNGYDVVIKRKGTTREDTKYKVMQGERCELGNPEWLADSFDLMQYCEVPDADQLEEMWDEIRAIVMGSSKDKKHRRKEEEAEQPRRQRRTARSAQDDVKDAEWEEDDS